MKKYILLLIACIAVCVSCKNDEIDVITHYEYDMNFHVNPSTVLQPYTFEKEPGELTSFDENYELRVRLLVYDKQGQLVDHRESNFSNYEVLMNTDITLEKGEYIALAITDVKCKTKKEGYADEYWTLVDMDDLSKTCLKRTKYIGGEREILGITKKNFSVNESASLNSVNIDVQPAGALMYIFYHNVHHWSDVEDYRLAVNKIAKSCIFDLSGDYDVVFDKLDKDNNWKISIVYPEYQTANGVYDKTFLLPLSNMKMQFLAVLDNGKFVPMAEPMYISLKAGDEYGVEFFIDDALGQCNVLNLKKSRAPYRLAEDSFQYRSVFEQDRVYLNDIK